MGITEAVMYADGLIKPKAKRRLSPARGSALRGLGWSYSHYRASLYLDGERFAIVTPDGRNALSRKDAKLLLEALNRKAPNESSQATASGGEASKPK